MEGLGDGGVIHVSIVLALPGATFITLFFDEWIEGVDGSQVWGGWADSGFWCSPLMRRKERMNGPPGFVGLFRREHSVGGPFITVLS